MLTHRPATAPLMSKSSGFVRSQPAALDALAPRPLVLSSPSSVPRQLSLFTRPGALR